MPTKSSMSRWASLSPATLYPLLDWFIPPSLREESRCCSAPACSSSAICSVRCSATRSRSTSTFSSPRPTTRSMCWRRRSPPSGCSRSRCKFTGRFTFLGLLSVQNLIFAILWGCYHYGGVSSPFLPWLLTVPLLAFFYLGAGPAAAALHPDHHRFESRRLLRRLFDGARLSRARAAVAALGHRHHLDAVRRGLCVDDGALLRQHRRVADRARARGPAPPLDRAPPARREARGRARQPARNPSSWRR